MMFCFGKSTSFDEITEPTIPIGVESFWFRNHSELLGLASTNSRLPGTALLLCKFVYYDQLFNNNHPTDIVGEIAAVKSTITDPLQNNNRLTATIKMDKLLIVPYLSIQILILVVYFKNYYILITFYVNVISDVSVTMSLFDLQAVKLHKQLE